MADATPAGAGTSSTPPAEPVAAAPAASSASPPPADTPASEPVKATAPPADSAQATPDPAQPIFTLPDDFKAPEAMVAKFTEFAKGLPDPKLAQQVADLYVGLAREANTSWQAQIQKLDADNQAACKARFSSEDLKAAETGIGFLNSREPGFRDVFAKRQLNDPMFIGAMRLVGESLSEDSLGRPSPPPPPPKDNRSLRERAQEGLYGRKPS